jgi:Flp pilus assembly protein TadG
MLLRRLEHGHDYSAGAARSCRRGAAAVEFALVASTFFLVVMGIVDIGRGFMVVHLLNNAARMGCRVGIIEGKANSDINTEVLAALAGQGISGDTATIQVNDNTADASTANPADEITVMVTVPIGSVMWLPGTHFITGTLGGRDTMRRE